MYFVFHASGSPTAVVNHSPEHRNGSPVSIFSFTCTIHSSFAGVSCFWHFARQRSSSHNLRAFSWFDQKFVVCPHKFEKTRFWVLLGLNYLCVFLFKKYSKNAVLQMRQYDYLLMSHRRTEITNKTQVLIRRVFVPLELLLSSDFVESVKTWRIFQEQFLFVPPCLNSLKLRTVKRNERSYWQTVILTSSWTIFLRSMTKRFVVSELIRDHIRSWGFLFCPTIVSSFRDYHLIINGMFN